MGGLSDWMLWRPQTMPDRSNGSRQLAKLATRMVLVAVALLASGYLVWHFGFARPAGAGPAGPAVALKGLPATNSHGPVFLLGMGDSVTAGFGARKGYAYFDRLLTNAPEDPIELRSANLRTVFPKLTARNIAVSGSTSLDHVTRQVTRIPRVATNVFGLVVLTTGGNDLIHHYGRMPPRDGAMYGASLEEAWPWIAAFEKRLGLLLDRIADAFPGGCHIFLATIYDPTDGVGDLEHAGLGLPRWPDAAAIHGAYNGVIRRAAQSRRNVTMVDIHEAFLGHGIHCTQLWLPHYRREDPHYWYYENLEDPNERGYDAIRRLFLNAIVDWLRIQGAGALGGAPG